MERTAQINQKYAITGIESTDAESFIASALFDQGWNVQYRALDADSLIANAQQLTGCDLSLFLSNNLEGLDNEKVEILKAISRRIYLFKSGDTEKRFAEEIAMPADSLELANLLRSSQRTPLIQKRGPVGAATARIIGISAVTHGLGCTTVAINLAHELTILGASVLLVDGDSQNPSIAHALDERSLHTKGTWRERHGKASLMEISQKLIGENIENLDCAARTFDYIVVDLSVLSSLTQTLISRRWEAEAAIWVSKNATELWIISNGSEKCLRSLALKVEDLRFNQIKPRLRFVALTGNKGRREQSAMKAIAEMTQNVEQGEILEIPVDERSARIAESRKVTLFECNERGPLRKAIKNIAERARA